MSAQELDRLTVIERVLEKRLSQLEASKQLGVTTRQMRRLIESHRQDGAAGLVSKKRSMRGNRAYPVAVKNAVIALVRQRYHDFGPTFIAQFNAKFAKEPANEIDLHRLLTELDQLDEILSWQEERTVSHSLTVQYDRVVYLLEPTNLARDLQRKKVRVFDYPDGAVAIKYEGAELPYSVFDVDKRHSHYCHH